MKGKAYKILLSVLAAVLMLTALFMDPYQSSYAADSSYTIVDRWEPTSLSDVPDSATASSWQVISGSYFDGDMGRSMENLSKEKDAVTQKNVIDSGTENLFYVSLKVKAKVSWADVLDATAVWLQNGNSASSAKKEYFLSTPPTGYSYKTVYVKFRDSVSPDVSGNIVYVKKFYIAQDQQFNTGKWFLYWGNPLLDNNNHSYGQKNNIVDGESYDVPIGQYMSSYDQNHHAVVAETVTDTMEDGIKIDHNAGNNGILYSTSGTQATVNGDTISWKIHESGTIATNTFTEYTKETSGSKTSYYREYNLVYAIHLDASDEDFRTQDTYPLNASGDEAVLNYTFDPRPTGGEATYPYPSNPDRTLAFKVPEIEGSLYTFRFRKLDAETGQPIKGVTFKLTGTYGATAKLNSGDYNKAAYEQTAVSDENGYVTFDDLPWGTYSFSETYAPAYYEINDGAWSVTLNYTNNKNNYTTVNKKFKLNDGIVSDIKDKVKKTSLAVTKTWSDGNDKHKNDTITVHLLADGEDTNKTVTLKASNSWSGSFPDLNMYHKDGTAIVYTVSEDPVVNYFPTYNYSVVTASGTKTDQYVWVPVDKFEDGGEYVIVESDGTGSVLGLTAVGNKTDKVEQHKFAWTTGQGAKTVNVTSGSVNTELGAFDRYITDADASTDNALRMHWIATYIRDQSAHHVTDSDTTKIDWYSLQSKYLGSYMNITGASESEGGNMGSTVALNDTSSMLIHYGLSTAARRQPTNSGEDAHIIFGLNDYWIKVEPHTGGDKAAQPFYLYKRAALIAQDGETMRCDITNEKGKTYILPDTGGIGTYAFTFFGSLLMVLAIALYRRRKGMEG